MILINETAIFHVPSGLRIRYLEEWDAAMAYSTHLRNGVVLNRTAYLVFSLCDGVRTVADVCSWVCEYAKPALMSQETVATDVIQVLENMQEWGLLEK